MVWTEEGAHVRKRENLKSKIFHSKFLNFFNVTARDAVLEVQGANNFGSSVQRSYTLNVSLCAHVYLVWWPFEKTDFLKNCVAVCLNEKTFFILYLL